MSLSLLYGLKGNGVAEDQLRRREKGNGGPMCHLSMGLSLGKINGRQGTIKEMNLKITWNWGTQNFNF